MHSAGIANQTESALITSLFVRSFIRIGGSRHSSSLELCDDDDMDLDLGHDTDLDLDQDPDDHDPDDML